MPQARILVCFYSRTGHTRRLAQWLQHALDAQLEELHERPARRAWGGPGKSWLESLRRRPATLAPTQHDPAAFDLLVLGGPVWFGRLAAPVRAYAGGPGRRAQRVAFFCTRAHRSTDRAFADLERLCGRARVASLAVENRRATQYSGRHDRERFVVRLAHALAEANCAADEIALDSQESSL